MTDHSGHIGNTFGPNGFSIGSVTFFVGENGSGKSTVLEDLPLSYMPPHGPAVTFRLRYSQRASGSGQTPSFGYPGDGWRHDWLAYVFDNNTKPVAPYTWSSLTERGFGSEQHNPYTPAIHWRTRAELVKISQDPPRYERTLPDGTVEVYAFPDRAASLPGRSVFLTQVIDPQGQSLTFSYDANIRLVAVTDALGQVTTLSYEDAVNPLRLTRVTDPFERSAVLTYGSSGQLASITDAIGMTTSFAYDATGFLRAMTTPYGTTTFRNEDVTVGAAAHRAVSATDPEGGTERIEYWSSTAVGLPSTVPAAEVPAGFSAMNSSLDLFNSLYWSKQAMAEAPNDRAHAVVTRWLVKNEGGYDPHAGARAIAHSVKRPLETRVWYRYPDQTDANGAGTGVQPSQIARLLDDGTTQLTQATYNPHGHMTSQTDPVGRQTTYTYAANDIDLTEVRQTTASGSDLIRSLGGYTSQHRPTTVTDAAGQTTTLTYNSAGQPLTVTNAKSETTTFAYDAGGNGYLVSATGPVTGATVGYAYDSIGRLQTVTQSDGYSVTTAHDALNRVTSVAYPDGTSESFIYDKLQISERHDRAGRITRYFYDRNGRLTAVRDPLGRTIRQDWCGCGQMAALVDANGNRTAWTRDAGGRITQEVRADGTTTTQYSYEGSGRLHTVTDPKGQITTYAYSADDRVIGVTYSNATIATPGVTFTFDAQYPRLTTMVDGVGTTSYTYRAPGQLGAGQVDSVDGPLTNDTITYGYDELGRVVSRTIDSVAVTWAFDALGRVTTETNVLGVFASTYDGQTPRLATVTYPNGQTTTYTYRPASENARLQTIHHKYPGGATLSKFDYTYDAVGNIMTWRQQADTTAVQWTYGYDAADQLVQAVKSTTDPTPTILQRFGYAYDPAGNRTAEQIDDGVTGATHNALNQLISQQPSGSLTFAGTVSEPATVTIAARPATVTNANAFRGSAVVPTGTSTVAVTATDASGNAATRSYQVTQAGTSKTLTYDVNGNLTNDGIRTFTWDAENRLISVATGVHVSSFAYDGESRRVRILETDNGATVSDTRFVWCALMLCENRDSSGTVLKRYFDDGVQENGTGYFYSRDHLNSVRELTDDSTTIRARYDYDSWGRRTKLFGSKDADLGFTGHYQHAFSGLILAPFRAYDSTLGRWISEDPLGLDAGPNRYAYVDGRPTTAYDPLGENPLVLALPWLGGIGAGATAPAWLPPVLVGGALITTGIVIGALWDQYFTKPPRDAYDPNGPKAPGKPPGSVGFKDPKGGEGWVRNPNGPGSGWLDENGDVWVPTGKGPTAHGGPHWDVQSPGGGYRNVRPPKLSCP